VCTVQSTVPWFNHWFRLTALLVLLALIGLLTLLGPLPSLGFDVDLATARVVTVHNGSPAAEVGIRPGDRLIAIYGYHWEEINHRWVLLPLPWTPGTPTPLTVDRSGETLDLTLVAGPPDLGIQVEKGLRALIAFSCWGAGFLLGTSPRAVDRRLQWAAWFWIVLGLTIGLYQLVSITSYVLSIAVLWLQCTILAPIAVALHLWYPSRPIATAVQRRGRTLLIAVIAFLQVGAALLVFTAPSTILAFERLTNVAPFIFLGGFLASSLVLWCAYRTITVASIRRQVRLIGIACVLAMSWWLLLLLGTSLAPDIAVVIPPGAYTVGAGVIPLAYLLSGVSADLMRLDQIARRLLVHAVASVASVAVVAACNRLGLLQESPALLFLLAAGLYWPLLQLTASVVGSGTFSYQRYEPLRKTTTRLTTTLDSSRLAAMLGDGIRCTFQYPPVAVYYRKEPVSGKLCLALAHDIVVPETIEPEVLAGLRDTETALFAASSVQARLGQELLDADTTALVFHDTVFHWGVIRRTDGHILGLLLIGPRGDRDPYRSQDLREIDGLLAGAALAFANSASYTEQVQAQRLIRRIYRHAQEVQEQTAAAIARDIHDELLNVTLRLNMESLQSLIAQVDDAHVRAGLALVLEAEQSASQYLRQICQELGPTGMEDPYGLAASLRQRIDQIRKNWGVPITFVVEGEAIPIDRRVHRELVRIAREAVVNACKHAAATHVEVTLRYAATPDGVIVLLVRDNGQVNAPIVAKAGHFGIAYMRESACAIDATIAWERPPAGGTEVVVTIDARSAMALDGQAVLVLPAWVSAESSAAHELRSR
jgi:signal transduction histidine kinase